MGDHAARAPRAERERGPLRLLFVGGDFVRKGGDLLLDAVTGPFAGQVIADVVTRDRRSGTVRRDRAPVRAEQPGAHRALRECRSVRAADSCRVLRPRRGRGDGVGAARHRRRRRRDRRHRGRRCHGMAGRAAPCRLLPGHGRRARITVAAAGDGGAGPEGGRGAVRRAAERPSARRRHARAGRRARARHGCGDEHGPIAAAGRPRRPVHEQPRHGRDGAARAAPRHRPHRERREDRRGVLAAKRDPALSLRVARARRVRCTHCPNEARWSGVGRRFTDLARVFGHHRGGILHVHSTGFHGGDLVMLAGRAARVAGIVRTEHVPPQPPTGRRHRIQVRLRDRLLLDKAICVSESNRREHVAVLGRRAGKFTVVPNGIDLERFAAEDGAGVHAELGLPPTAPLVGVVARLAEERKGISPFLRMAAAVSRRRPRRALRRRR